MFLRLVLVVVSNLKEITVMSINGIIGLGNVSSYKFYLISIFLLCRKMFIIWKELNNILNHFQVNFVLVTVVVFHVIFLLFFRTQSKLVMDDLSKVLIKTPITDDYTLSKNVLGIGINGKVVECYSKTNPSQKYALKVSICLLLLLSIYTF